MSRFEFKLPDIGEGVTEGEVVQWLVSEGEIVCEDQPMVEVMTDKATVTITSPKAGTIARLAGPAGSVVPVHSVLVVFELAGGSVPPAAAPLAKASEGPAATAVGDIRETLPGMDLAQPRIASAASPPVAPSSPDAASSPDAVGRLAANYYNEKPLATPATRKLARDRAIDLRSVAPTGPNGRVLKGDVERAAQSSSPPELPARSAATLAVPARPPVAVVAPSPVESALEVRSPLKGVRKKIFDAMGRSVHTAAHFTFVEECDVTALKALRERLRPLAAEQGVKLTFLPFFVKAVVAALKKHPQLNSAYDESTNEIVVRRYYNIGIAASTEQGLMVPVIKDADKKSLLEVAADIQRLGEATKSGKVAADDLRGSTFTITSLGQQGGLFATPILNMPEVGILGLHQMKQKPVVRNGEIVIGDVQLLSLSFDHRLIDGHIGAAFAYEIIAAIENPDRLFLEL